MSAAQNKLWFNLVVNELLHYGRGEYFDRITIHLSIHAKYAGYRHTSSVTEMVGLFYNNKKRKTSNNYT